MDQTLRFLDDNINPLLLRELRQMVRSQFVIVLINLFIAILVLVSMMTVLLQQETRLTGLGNALFGGLTAVLSIACFLTVVVNTAITTSAERLNGDLMFTSSLKPSSIVVGKMLAGMILTLILVSLTAPFLVLAYLLRGLDMEWVAATLLVVFCWVQLLNSLAICLFANVKTKTQMSALSILGFFLALFILPNFLAVFLLGSHFIMTGVNWNALGWFFLLIVAGIALLHTIAVASVSPPASNRFLPFRITVTVIYLGSLAVVLLFPSSSIAPNSLILWAGSWCAGLAFLFVFVSCEGESWSFRIKKTIPHYFLTRYLCFPFFSGSPNGVVWAVLLSLGVFAALPWAHRYGASGWDGLSIALAFSFNYCVTAMLIRSFFLSKYLLPDKNWAIILAMLLLFTFGSMFAYALFMGSSEWGSYGFWDAYDATFFSALNPFMDDSGSEGWIRICGAGIWGLGTVIAFLGWFGDRIRNFSPTAISGVMTFAEAIDAVRQADANPLVKGIRDE